MDGKENAAFDEESPPTEEEPTKLSDEGRMQNNNGHSKDTVCVENMDEEQQDSKKKKWQEILAKIRKVCTGKRVGNTLLVAYFIGALLYWFVFNDSERQWQICQDEGLILVLIFFYLCYVLYMFSPYIYKFLRFTLIPLCKLIIKVLGPTIAKVLFYGLQVAGLTAYLIWDIWDDFSRWRSIIGVFKNILVLWVCSPYKRKINWEVPVRSLLLQFYICLIMLRIQFVNDFVTCITNKFTAFLDFSKGGGEMVFGEELANNVFAFMVMPVILFLSFVVAVLNHLDILPSFISALGRALLNVLGTHSEVEAFNSAASIFLGQTESPILIQKYLPKLTRAELFTIMVGGLSTIAGAVLAAYIQFGISAVHLITASIMSAIGTVGLCKILMPDIEPSQTKTMVTDAPKEKSDVNIFDLTTSSALTAIEIIKSIMYCLIIWLSAIPFVNSVVENGLYLLCGLQGVTFQYLLGLIFTPFAYLMGADWVDSGKVGELIGIKIIINEFVAYTELKALQGIITERSMTVATYALCGFSNFGAMATLVSTLKVMAPSRIKDITRNAYWSLLVANIVCDMTACIAGALTQ